MIEVAERFEDYQMVLAGAPSIDDAYEKFMKVHLSNWCVTKTYPLLSHAAAALVTSGTFLETALFDVPQVVYVMKRLYLISHPFRFQAYHQGEVYLAGESYRQQGDCAGDVCRPFTVDGIINELYGFFRRTGRIRCWQNIGSSNSVGR